MTQFWRTAWLSTMLLVSACGGRARIDEDAPRAVHTSADVGAPLPACGRYAEAACARMVRCAVPDRPFAGANFVSVERCVERMQLACSQWRLLPGIGMSEARVTSCADFVQGSDCRRPVDELWNVFAFCPATRGELPAGSAVVSARQCASGAARSDRGCKVCSVEDAHGDLPQGACDVEHPCPAGACRGGWCTGEPGQPRQVPEVDVSSARCSGIDVPRVICAPGLACVGQNDRGSGACMPFAPDGAPCAYEGPGCEWPASCRDGRCALPTAACSR